MTKRNIVLFAGTAVVLTGIIAASLILTKGRHSEVKGYEAVLAFETVRHDGRNVEVKYDGTYHFQLV